MNYVHGVQEFIKLNWSDNHPLLSTELFLWQYKGFGPKNNYQLFKLVLDDKDNIVGFRGVIPGLYQVPTRKKSSVIVPGGSGAMWMMSESARGQGLGLRLFEELQKEVEVTMGLGSNKVTAIPFYKKAGFKLHDGMERLFYPLSQAGFSLMYGRSQSLEGKSAIVPSIEESIANSGLKLINPDALQLASIWTGNPYFSQTLSLYRNKDFWQWRYIDSKGFQYSFLSDESISGIFIFRSESLNSHGMPKVKVFRLIEFVPRVSPEGGEKEVETLIRSLIFWCSKNQYDLIDFYPPNPVLANRFQEFNFKSNSYLKLRGVKMPAIYSPYIPNASPINFHWKVNDKIPTPSNYPWYVAKSDNDMDRPVILNK